MLLQISLGCFLMVVTTFVHAAGMVLSLGALRLVHVERWVRKNALTRAGMVSVLVLLMFLVTFVESLIWAVVYVEVGALPTLDEALYFSAVTYTTVGYGDLVLEGAWRHLGGFEAANGMIMFGWTAALIFAVVQRVYFVPHSFERRS